MALYDSEFTQVINHTISYDFLCQQCNEKSGKIEIPMYLIAKIVKTGKNANFGENDKSDLNKYAKYLLISELANINLYSYFKEYKLIFDRLLIVLVEAFCDYYFVQNGVYNESLEKNFDTLKKNYNVCPHCGNKQIWSTKKKLFSKTPTIIETKYLPNFNLELSNLGSDLQTMYNDFIIQVGQNIKNSNYYSTNCLCPTVDLDMVKKFVNKS
ncbi:MAG: hypothetical protein LBK83_15600 [Treponema sp.]|jgi:hypothetical protein|nr:hypothetical protein [Treponema sp.]